MSNAKSFGRVCKNIYNGSIIAAGTLGSLYGVKDGYESASTICFQKKELSYKEYLGEVVCFSGITASSTILYGALSGLVTSTLPVTIPLGVGYKIYNMKTDKNDTLNDTMNDR